MAVWPRNADRSAVIDGGGLGTENVAPLLAALASDIGVATGAVREEDAPLNPADSVKSSLDVYELSVFTTAIRYCDPACNVSDVLKLAEVRNATDCPAVLSVMPVPAGATMNVTVSDCGLFVTPDADDVIGTVAVYVPAARLPSVAVSISVAGAEVPLRLVASQPVDCPAP
jgi:hypothetical protein